MGNNVSGRRQGQDLGGCTGRGQSGLWVVPKVVKSQESREGQVSGKRGQQGAVNAARMMSYLEDFTYTSRRH